jgi:CrcB protein
MEFARDIGLAAAGGALGSTLRYGAGVWLSQRVSHGFPWHTFVVNVVGAFALGVLVGRTV